MLLQSRRRRAFAISLASCWVLFCAPTKIIADPAVEPDIPSTTVAPEPHSVNEQIKLAGDYLAGRGVPQNSQLSAYWYEKAAGAGDPHAQLEIGYFYQAGIGVARDPARAAHWYQLAASSGSLFAKVNLAIAYLWGTGVPANSKLALKLLNEAADGSGLAACYLGDFYAFGIGMPVDQAAAERWYRKGVSLHDPWRNSIWGRSCSTAQITPTTLLPPQACSASLPRRVMFPRCTAWEFFWFAIPRLLVPPAKQQNFSMARQMQVIGDRQCCSAYWRETETEFPRMATPRTIISELLACKAGTWPRSSLQPTCNCCQPGWVPTRLRRSIPKLSIGFRSTILCLRSSIRGERRRTGSPRLP